MAESANWGMVTGLIDNASERRIVDDDDNSAYVMDAAGEGMAKPRGFGMTMPKDKEPIGVWVLVVGSIVGLVLISRGFRTVKA